MKIQIPKDDADRIKNPRKKNGLAQTALAERLGVSIVSINRWESEYTPELIRSWS